MSDKTRAAWAACRVAHDAFGEFQRRDLDEDAQHMFDHLADLHHRFPKAAPPEQPASDVSKPADVTTKERFESWFHQAWPCDNRERALRSCGDPDSPMYEDLDTLHQFIAFEGGRESREPLGASDEQRTTLALENIGALGTEQEEYIRAVFSDFATEVRTDAERKVEALRGLLGYAKVHVPERAPLPGSAPPGDGGWTLLHDAIDKALRKSGGSDV